MTNKVNCTARFKKRVNFFNELTQYLKNKLLLLKQLSKLSERRPTASPIFNTIAGVLLNLEKNELISLVETFLLQVLNYNNLSNRCLLERLLRAN